jgi:hypothetical protein
MTWQAYVTVQAVSEKFDPHGWEVTLVAHNGEQVQPYKSDPKYAGSSYREDTVPAVVSNTEGELSMVEVRLLIDGQHAPLAVGDLVSIGGHFDRRQPQSTDAASSPSTS